MGLNPVIELKRRLDDADAPLAKRLCLARNVASTHYLPTAAKEKVLTDWLHDLVPGDAVVTSVLEWRVAEVSVELQGSLVEVVAKYLENNAARPEVTQKIIFFLENERLLQQLTTNTDHFLFITRTLLKQLQESGIQSKVVLCQRLLENIAKVYKAVIRKVDFITKFLDGETIEVVLACLNVPDLRDASLKVCQTVLFPGMKKSHFLTFLQTLIKKESIDELLKEKGDSIKSVVKIMSAFFTFPQGRSSVDADFINSYIDAFVSSFRSENHLIFAFYIMAINTLNIRQTYLIPAMSMPTIHFKENDEDIKRDVFLKALVCLKENDIDLNVRLTDTIGEKVTKVEIKKNFMSFLQAALMTILKLDTKPDIATLNIITLALHLDPNLIEPKMDKILPIIMTSKKTDEGLLEAYTEMLNCLLDTLFKLSRGTEFLSVMLPLLKLRLEPLNTKQFEMQQQYDPLIGLCSEHVVQRAKLMKKIIVGEDLFPPSCVERYGKLSSELTLKQNGELFVSLQKEFETHCFILLSEGFVSPSLIILSEVLAAILSSVLEHSKMADHTVPLHIAQEFWSNFQLFETELLTKYSGCLLSLSYNNRLETAFLRLCVSYTKLKLLNLRYGNLKGGDFSQRRIDKEYDFGLILPCMSADQWETIYVRAHEEHSFGSIEALTILQVQKLLACDLLSAEENSKELEKYKHKIKLNLVESIYPIWNDERKMKFDNVFQCPYFEQVIFNDLDGTTEKTMSKSLLQIFKEEPSCVSVLESAAVSNNATLLTSLVLETLKGILRVVEDEKFLLSHKSVRKAIKAGFEFEEIIKGRDVPALFENLPDTTILQEEENVSSILNALDILKSLQIPFLDENTQLLSIFVILALKRICSNAKSAKKIKKSIDSLLLSIFELTPKIPDMFKVFPIEFIFSFNDNLFLDLVKLNRTKANRSIVVKAILESAVKKVKTDSEIVKGVVKILLANQKVKKHQESSITYFSNEVFQTTCMILPIIAKEKKAITTSAYRSILADLQEKLHKSLLKTFKNIDFCLEKSLFLNRTENLEDSVTAEMSESTLATLNAVEAYSLTLSKYCEASSPEDSSSLDCLLESLGYFVENAVTAIRSTESKPHHIDASVQLLNIVLRNIRKLATHDIFREKDKLFLQMWQALKSRLLAVFSIKDERRNTGSLDDVSVTIKLLCELCSVDFFTTHLSVDLGNLMALKAPAAIISSKCSPNSVLTSHQVATYLWSSILKANIVGPKSAAMSKSMFRATKNLTHWLRTHFDVIMSIDDAKVEVNGEVMVDDKHDDESEVVANKSDIDDEICEVIRCDLDALAEAIINAKKVTLGPRSLDGAFELHARLLRALRVRGARTTRFLALLDGALAVLNRLLLHREELLEDRWPCYLQCYRGVVACLCARAAADAQLDRATEERLAETAHSLEKLTQAICKRRAQVSRLAAYLVADICSALERSAPAGAVRQHLGNCVALLIQASESTYSAAFLRRALAGSPGHVTMFNLYTMYKRYHKYVGTS